MSGPTPTEILDHIEKYLDAMGRNLQAYTPTLEAAEFVALALLEVREFILRPEAYRADPVRVVSQWRRGRVLRSLHLGNGFAACAIRRRHARRVDQFATMAEEIRAVRKELDTP